MKLRTIFMWNTVVAVVFALGELLGPDTVLKLFGFSTGKSEVVLTQVLGAALLGFAALTWFARDFADPQATRAATISLLIFTTVGFVVALLGMLSQVTRSASAWLVVVLFLFFAGGYAHFQFAASTE